MKLGTKVFIGTVAFIGYLIGVRKGEQLVDKAYNRQHMDGYNKK